MSPSNFSPAIKVVSFDLDDTLWPCLPTIKHAENLLYQWLSDHVPQITQKYDINQLREKRSVLHTKHPELSHDLTTLRMKSFEVLVEEFSLSSDWVSSAFDVFYQARQKVTLFDDVKPVLDELKKSYQLVSLTNGNASTVKTGVDHWFDFALNSEMIGKMKSEPEIYLQAQKLTGVSPLEMVHIGDHPMQDVLGAKIAGVFAIWLNREGKAWSLDACEPDAEINSLHELPALLESITEAR